MVNETDRFDCLGVLFEVVAVFNLDKLIFKGVYYIS